MFRVSCTKASNIMSGVTAATDAGIHYSVKAGGVMFLFVLSFCHLFCLWAGMHNNSWPQ